MSGPITLAEWQDVIADMLAEHEPTWGCTDPNHTTQDVAHAIAVEVCGALSEASA